MIEPDQFSEPRPEYQSLFVMPTMSDFRPIVERATPPTFDIATGIEIGLVVLRDSMTGSLNIASPTNRG